MSESSESNRGAVAAKYSKKSGAEGKKCVSRRQGKKTPPPPNNAHTKTETPRKTCTRDMLETDRDIQERTYAASAARCVRTRESLLGLD